MEKRQINAVYNQYGDRVRPDGFRVFRLPDEEYLFYRIGPEELTVLLNTSFEYSCLEAEFLGKTKRGEWFRNLCESNRSSIIIKTADYLDEADKKRGIGKAHYEFRPFSREEMMQLIREQYESERVEKLKHRKICG